MILQHRLNTLTEDEWCVLLHVVNSTAESNIEFNADDIKCIKPSWLKASFITARSSIKPEHTSVMESVESKLFAVQTVS